MNNSDEKIVEIDFIPNEKSQESSSIVAEPIDLFEAAGITPPAQQESRREMIEQWLADRKADFDNGITPDQTQECFTPTHEEILQYFAQQKAETDALIQQQASQEIPPTPEELFAIKNCGRVMTYADSHPMLMDDASSEVVTYLTNAVLNCLAYLQATKLVEPKD